MLYTNRCYVDPSNVLSKVVDSSGQPVLIGNEQDSMEYLLNFMERLEEGLNERSSDVQKNLRVSMYARQISSTVSDSILTESTEETNHLEGYGHIDDSFF